MYQVFGSRSLIYWWGVLTATIFVKDWLASLAKLFHDPNVINSTKIPFSMLPGLNKWVDDAADYVKKAIDFNPTQEIAKIGPVSIPGWALAVLLGIVLIVIAVQMYMRALNSPAWYDDFITLFALYVILRLEGHTVGSTKLPVLDWFRALIENQAVTFFILLILMLVLSFFGEGLRSVRAFWRALLEALLLTLFMYPRQAADLIGLALDTLAQFGGALLLPENFPFAVAWGVIGMLLALQRLTTPEGAGSKAPAKE
jgi:hypothetical protein